MEAVRIYQGSEEALRSGQGRLANAYRTYCERGSSDGQQLNVSVNAGVPITAGERRDRLDAPAEVARRQLRNDYVTDPSMDRAHSVLESDASGVRNDGLANAPGQTPASFQAAPDLMTTRQEQNMQTPLPSWTMSHATAAQYVPPSNNGSTLFSDQSNQAGLVVRNFGTDSAPNVDDLWPEEWYPLLYDEFYGFS
jgi:hypothetical protein